MVIVIHLVRRPHFCCFYAYMMELPALFTPGWIRVTGIGLRCTQEGSSDWKHSVWWEPLFFRIDHGPWSGAAVMSFASVITHACS